MKKQSPVQSQGGKAEGCREEGKGVLFFGVASAVKGYF